MHSLEIPTVQLLNFRADLSETAMVASPEPATHRKRPIAGVGRVVVWPGASIWIGRRVGGVPQHAHHAIQISLALDGPFEIQARAWPAPIRTRSAVVMPDEPHRLDGLGSAVATIFIEPNSSQGAAVRKRFGQLDIGTLLEGDAERAAAPLREAFDRGVSDEHLAQYARGAICRIAGDPNAAPRSDARVNTALEWMRAHLAEPIRLQDVAAAVHLSPGRFRHLFVAQTGTSFRAWLLWARAEAAIASATRGTSWTDAAQEAGFSDAAHFTRTCRRVFGIAPTMLLFAGPGRSEQD